MLNTKKKSFTCNLDTSFFRHFKCQYVTDKLLNLQPGPENAVFVCVISYVLKYRMYKQTVFCF